MAWMGRMHDVVLVIISRYFYIISVIPTMHEVDIG